MFATIKKVIITGFNHKKINLFFMFLVLRFLYFLDLFGIIREAIIMGFNL